MKNSIYWIAVGLCVLVIVWKLITILGYGTEYHRSDQVYEQLAAMTTEEIRTVFRIQKQTASLVLRPIK